MENVKTNVEPKAESARPASRPSNAKPNKSVNVTEVEFSIWKAAATMFVVAAAATAGSIMVEMIADKINS